MQIPDIWQLLHQYQKEVTVAVVTAVCTLVFSRLLPVLAVLTGKGISALWALVTGKHRYQAFEREYLKWLINENKYMTMVPSEVVNPEKLPRPPELQRIFIRLRLKRGAEIERETLMDEVLGKGSRTVILGDPGSGKTTLIKHMCLGTAMLLRSSRLHQQKVKAIRAAFGPIRRAVPVLIYLHRFNQYTAQELQEKSLLNALVEILPESLRGKCPKDYFARLAAQGESVFLFDGLDEISDQGVRDEVSKMMGSLANASAPDVTWIVTSRIVGYRAHLNQSGFRTSVVEELSRAQIQSYVSGWYREKCLRSDYSTSELSYQLEQHESRARRLCDTLSVNVGLASLATNPMLLSLITLLHSVQLELPDNRAILYRDCVELLCDRWDLFRGVSRDEKVRLSVGEKMSLVIAIAWHLHSQRTRDIDRPALVEVIRQHLRGALGVTDASPEGVIRQLEERSGLLITRGTNETGQRIMAFSHLSFQEYLASVALQSISATDVSGVVCDSLRDSWWRETVLLYVAQLENPTDLIRGIYGGRFGEDDFSNLLLAGACLAEVRISRENEVYPRVMDDLIFLYSSGLCRFDTKILDRDKYHTLVRQVVANMNEATELRRLIMELLLDVKRGRKVIGSAGYAKLRSILHGKTLLSREEADAFILLWPYLGWGLPEVVWITKKMPPRNLRRWRSVMADIGGSIDQDAALVALLSEPMSWGTWLVAEEIGGKLGKGSGEPLSHGRCPQMKWNERITRRILRSKIARLKPAALDLNSFVEALQQGHLREAAGMLHFFNGSLDASSETETLLVEIYQNTGDAITRLFCIMAILRMSDLSAKVDEVLMEFALAALLAKGESLPNYGIVGDRIFSVLLGKNYLRYLALQCLNRLEKPRNGSVQFVQLLFACIQSDVPEAQDYAALATTTLTGVDEDSVALCLKTLRSDQAVQMAVVVNILGRIGRYDEQVATALLHEISNKERSGPLGAVSDLAASALLRILAS